MIYYYLIRRFRIMKNRMCRVRIRYTRRLIYTVILIYVSSFLLTNIFDYKPFNWFDHIVFDEDLEAEVLEKMKYDLNYTIMYMKLRYKNNLHILLWTDWEFFPFHFHKVGIGQQQFTTECGAELKKCVFTSDRNLFGGDLMFFNAILFNGRSFYKKMGADMPSERSPFQKYIYFSTESAEYYPLCDEKFDGYFNWSATYKLTSDLAFPFIEIENIEGDVVGPKAEMNWADPVEKIHADFANKLKKKSKAVAWFADKCMSKSGRENLVANLGRTLEKYKVSIDVYGKCGPLKYPGSRMEWETKLGQEYYFYLAFEETVAEDYVTEELLTALQNDVVPIVYGGVNYTRFLPPGSYIDAHSLSVRKLAKLIYRLINNPNEYRQYFRWRNQYQYSTSSIDYACSICESLHSIKPTDYSNVKLFRKWWNPAHLKIC